MYTLSLNDEYSLTSDRPMPLSKAKKEREEFLDGMARLIKYFAGWFEEGEGEAVLPEGYELQEDEQQEKRVPSLGQMVAMLNDNRHGTRYNNKWTRHSLKLLIEELEEKGVKLNVGHKNCKTSRANTQRSHNADRKAVETFETYMKDLDVENMTNSELARQLNKRGSKTIKGNEWSPAGCGHLLKRLKKLDVWK